MDTRTIDLGEVTLSVAEAGQGGRPLFLLHGFTGAKEDLTPWLDRLAEQGFHAVAPDHRGHGESSKPADELDYSLDTFAADVLALAEALGFEHFDLLGHSMGGMVAQHVVLDAPDHVTSLVLMNTGHGTVEGIEPELAELGIGLARQGMDALADVLASIESPLDTPAHQRLLAEHPEHREFDDRKLRACSGAMYAAMAIELLEEHDRLDDLTTVTVPTLVLVGEEDAKFLGPSERMAEAIPDARLVVLADAGHSPQFENPTAWEEAVFGFLAEVIEGAAVRG